MSEAVFVCDHCGQRLDGHAAAATHLIENHGIVDQHMAIYESEAVYQAEVGDEVSE